MSRNNKVITKVEDLERYAENGAVFKISPAANGQDPQDKHGCILYINKQKNISYGNKFF